MADGGRPFHSPAEIRTRNLWPGHIWPLVFANNGKNELNIIVCAIAQDNEVWL